MPPLPISDLLIQFIDPVQLRLLGLHIDGIEVTQGIQYYHSAQHLTDPAVRSSDNAMTLVAGKPAWVRVYLRSGLLANDIADVTGTLEVKRRWAGVRYDTIATLSPQPPGSVTAHRDPAYAAERGTLGASLNFIVSADDMCGFLLLRATVESGGHSDTQEVYVDVTLRQTLRLRGIMVWYNGPSSSAPNAANLTLAAPTIADLQTTSQWALLTYPVESAATYTSGGSISLTVPLDDAPSCAGCCSPNWVTLNAQVAAQVTADGNKTDVLYYGLLATGIPIGIVVGCESSGVSAGGVGDGETLAHEVGHHCGFPHAPCGAVGTPDPAYPAYPPYDPPNTPRASIGEYGLDISNGNIMSPAIFKDMMSYCSPAWISLHNYGGLLHNDKLDPRRSCVDDPWWRDIILYERPPFPEKWLPDPPPPPEWRVREVNPQPYISIIAVMRSEQELEVTSVMRLETRPSVLGAGVTDLSAQLLGADGEQLAQAPLRELRSQAHACGCAGNPEGRFPCIVQALIPDVARGAALAIRRGEAELWSVRAPATRPKITSFEAAYEEGDLSVSWSVEAAAETPEVWLQWSENRGRTWHALATGLKDRSARLDASDLPAGTIRLRLLVGDGFQTATSRIVRVSMPQALPAVSILSPRDGQTLIAGRAMRIWGALTLAGDRAKVRWMVDGNAVADAIDAFIVAPDPGEHRLELEVTTRGKVARVISGFRTIDPLAERNAVS